MEDVLGRGGQLQSFEAVFSTRGADGQPVKLWDRKTGAIDPKVAQAWRKYDIRLIVEKNWKTLGPKLAGKLHLFCGDQDTFYLEKAFFKLRDTLKELGSDAYIEVVPGADHGLPRSVFVKMNEQMAEQFQTRYVARHP
jgi:S-formylglutathione hydrolase FrmB